MAGVGGKLATEIWS